MTHQHVVGPADAIVKAVVYRDVHDLAKLAAIVKEAAPDAELFSGLGNIASCDKHTQLALSLDLSVVPSALVEDLIIRR